MEKIKKETLEKKRKKFIYICAPCRGDTREEVNHNIGRAISFGKEAYREGFIPIIPHLLTFVFSPSIKSEDRKGRECATEILSKCDLMWVCTTGVSAGMRKEIEFCVKHHIPLVFNLGKTKAL